MGNRVRGYRLSSNSVYAVLTSKLDSVGSRFRLQAEWGNVIDGWSGHQRVSPLVPISGNLLEAIPDQNFGKTNHLVFAGPVNPYQVLVKFKNLGIEQPCSAWLSYGLLNLVLRFSRKGNADKLTQFLREHGIPYERWKVLDGQVDAGEIELYVPAPSRSISEFGLSRLKPKGDIQELSPPIEEFQAIMSSILARSSMLPDTLMKDVQNFAEYTCSEFLPAIMQKDTFRAIGDIITLNAGISRFSSQMFSGVPNIQETECHFWSHSLLGIGTACIAVHNIVDFIDRALGEARIPERFTLYGQVTEFEPFDSAKDNKEDPISSSRIDELLKKYKEESSCSLITYFSARDGFRSNDLTISAPLASVSNANSRRWSLLTLSHEITHVIIREVLSDLYPDFDNDNEVAHCANLYRKGEKIVTNQLDALRLELYRDILGMWSARNGNAGAKTDFEVPLRKLRGDVEEIMVDTFDFLYFYNQNAEEYIAAIWTTWQVIPTVATRVEEYVIRSIAAIMSKRMVSDPDGCVDFAKEAALKALKKIKKSGQARGPIHDAISLIEKNWHSKKTNVRTIRQAVWARYRIVKIVRFYLYSESFSARLRADSSATSSKSSGKGYQIKPLTLSYEDIRNPLLFSSSFSIDEHPDQEKSLWLLSALAHNLRTQKDD